MPDPKPPEECANCGAAIPPGAKACPECGADDRTGWRETDLYDGLDLPDDSEDEAQRPRANRVNGIAWYWWVVALAIVLLFIGAFVLR